MAKLNSIPGFERLENVKPEELDGVVFDIVNVRGPYDGPYNDFLVFEIEYGDERRALLLADQAAGQRASLRQHFAAGGERVEGVRIVKLELEDGRTFWSFVDAEAE